MESPPFYDYRGPARFAEWLWGASPSPAARLLGICLSPLELAVFARTRRTSGRRKELSRPVVSVGNLVVGGTGKSPTIRWLAAALSTAGSRPAVLARGYGATAQALNDELLEIRGEVQGIPVAADPDRHAAGERLLTQHPDIDIFLLDDGFSHRVLRRDLDIVLFDATDPVGNGRLIPCGPLREPLDGLARAGAILLYRAERVPPNELAKLRGQLAAFAPKTPILEVDEVTRDPVPLASGASRPVSPALVCGIARHRPFLDEATRRFPGAACAIAFPDHVPYGPHVLRALERLFSRHGADGIVTTGKDAAKLQDLPAPGGLPVWVLGVEARPRDPERLLRLVLDAMAHPPPVS